MQPEAAQGGVDVTIRKLGSAVGRSVREGQLVRSVRGRDRGRWYLVMAKGDDGFIYVADGGQRTVRKQKKKNPKHLLVWSIIADGVAEALKAGKRVTDADVRDSLANITSSYEFNGEEVDDTGETRRD